MGISAGALTIVTGSTYVGNDSANRAIPHGLGRIPKAVIIVANSGNYNYHVVQSGMIHNIGTSFLAVTAMDATNFYVGNAGSYPNSGNATGTTYTWSAL